MPSVTCSRLLAIEQAEVWEFVKDMGNWAPFIMGYQSHQVIDENRSQWTVKGELGAFARTVRLDVNITEWVPPSRVTFELQGVTESIQGSGSVVLGVPERGYEQAAHATDTRSRWHLGALLARLVGRRRRRTRKLNEQVSKPLSAGSQTSLTFNLNLAASGMAAPMVNAMLEPLMLQAADEFADRLIEAIRTTHDLALDHD
jgi:carbon monoxide dehydrogenase subunit G